MASEFFTRWSSCSLKFSRECDRLPVQFEAKMKARYSSPVDIFLTFSDSVANTNRTLAISPIPLILREFVYEYQKKNEKKKKE